MRMWILMLLSIFILLGCVTSSPVEESETPLEREQDAAENAEPETKPEEKQPAEKTEKVVEETVYLVVREESSTTDGFIDRYSEILYEDEGIRRIEVKEFGLDGTLEKRKAYEYEGEHLNKVSTFDGSGSLSSYHLYSYSSAGLMISDSLYTEKKELQVQSLYEYDSLNRKVKWIVRNSDEMMQAYTDYIYGNNEEPKKIEMFTASGILEGYVELEYDARGRKVRETYREADGSVDKYIEYSYSGDVLMEENHYRGNKALLRRVTYGYDDNGNVSVILFYGPSGRIQDKKTRYYTTRSIQRVVVE